MRTFPWGALLLLLLVLPSPALAREAPAGRTVRTRTVYWEQEGAPPELHVAAGSATVVHIDALDEANGWELPEDGERVRFTRLAPSTLLLWPSSDFAVGERVLLTLRQGEVALPLALVSRPGEVDGEVRLLRLRAPTLEEGMAALVQHLNTAPQERVSLAGPRSKFQGVNGLLQVASVLRLGPRVLVTLVATTMGRRTQAWKQEHFRLRARLEDGARVQLPLLLTSGPTKKRHQRHTLVAPFPEQALSLELEVETEGTPTSLHVLPWNEQAP